MLSRYSIAIVNKLTNFLSILHTYSCTSYTRVPLILVYLSYSCTSHTRVPLIPQHKISRSNISQFLKPVMAGFTDSDIPNRDQWIVIGISGVTCGGKTTLAYRLRDALNPVCLFDQDKYFYPDDSPHHVRCAGMDHNNYDVLSSLDMARMYADVLATMAGDDGSQAHGERGAFEMKGKKFLIVEGFTLLNYKPILDLCDLRYYIVLEYGECAARRSLRVYSPPDVPGYFEACVWPEHLKYRAEVLKDRRVSVLDGTDPELLALVMADLSVITL